MSRAAHLATNTPDSRDRYVDLLRVVSLGVVIVGHWLMAVVLVGADGAVRTTNALALLPALQPLTWLLQVMPLFFLVGGFSHATALASAERRAAAGAHGGSPSGSAAPGPGGPATRQPRATRRRVAYADFVRFRAARLLRPTTVFVGVWLALALVLELTGRHHGVLQVATRTVAQPLWFVGVYLGVIALAPAMLRLHRRARRWAPAVPAALAAGAAAVDLARFRYGVPHVGYLNVLLVWLAVHQLGFLYAEGRLRRAAWVLAGAGLAATVALTSFGPYPVSMVGMPGERVSNMSPPTLALLAHAAWLTGLAVLLRGPVSRWLRRPRVWTAVVAANGLAMTAFLWHLTAMFAVTGLASVAGLAAPGVGSPAWWLQRPVWIVAFAIVTLGLVAAFRWADRPRTAAPGGHPAAGAVGMVLCSLGVLGLSAAGFGGVLAGRPATLVVVPVTPLLSAALLVAGAALLRAPAAGGSHPADHGHELPPATDAPPSTDHRREPRPATDAHACADHGHELPPATDTRPSTDHRREPRPAHDAHACADHGHELPPATDTRPSTDHGRELQQALVAAHGPDQR